jgi:hypothetical protein
MLNQDEGHPAIRRQRGQESLAGIKAARGRAHCDDRKIFRLGVTGGGRRVAPAWPPLSYLGVLRSAVRHSAILLRQSSRKESKPMVARYLGKLKILCCRIKVTGVDRKFPRNDYLHADQDGACILLR